MSKFCLNFSLSNSWRVTKCFGLLTAMASKPWPWANMLPNISKCKNWSLNCSATFRVSALKFTGNSIRVAKPFIFVNILRCSRHTGEVFPSHGREASIGVMHHHAMVEWCTYRCDDGVMNSLLLWYAMQHSASDCRQSGWIPVVSGMPRGPLLFYIIEMFELVRTDYIWLY